MNYEILVSRTEPFKKGAMTFELAPVQSRYKEGIELEKETYENWLKLKKDLEKKGYFIEIESGYRSKDYQAKILADLITEKGEVYASKAVAKPGHSEHHTGLALDYCVYRDDLIFEEGEIKRTKESIYANSIAHKYGFILRYPKGKEEITGYMYEPWHLRYVGKKLASYLYKKNMTLDEYYEGNEKNAEN